MLDHFPYSSLLPLSDYLLSKMKKKKVRGKKSIDNEVKDSISACLRGKVKLYFSERINKLIAILSVIKINLLFFQLMDLVIDTWIMLER